MNRAPEPRLADLDEPQILAALGVAEGSTSHSPGATPVIVGSGDDAAVIATGPRTIVTTDSMVRGIDWLDEWSSGEDVGIKVVTQNVADIAAMGGRASALVCALAADPQTPVGFVRELARGMREQARAYAAPLVGGDLSSAPPGVVVIAVTAFGDLGQRSPVLRSGARPGDVLAVSGPLGRSGAGLRLLRSGRAADPAAGAWVEYHRRPVIEETAGIAAANAGASAMLDVSDGLVTDAARIARASGIRLELDADALGVDAAALRPAVGDAAWDCVLNGGEEHSLIACFPGQIPDGWRVIGRVVDGAGVYLGADPVAGAGWDHFQPRQSP